MTIKQVIRILLIAIGAMLQSVLAASEPGEIRSKVRVEMDGIWLESELAPKSLIAALPQLDNDGDGHLDEKEISTGFAGILSYYADHMRLICDDRVLNADSTYFAFRSPALASALPDRFFIYHWYATMRRPQRLRIGSTLFCETPPACKHKGTLISNDTIVNFRFPAGETESGGAGEEVEFKFSHGGTPELVKWGDDITRAGYVWIGAGLSGLLLLRIAAAARKRRRRSQADMMDTPDFATLDNAATKLEMARS